MAMESLEYEQESTYSGWLFFAGTILGIAGLMRIIDGFWAFSYDGVLPENLEGALFGDDLAAYGWANIIIGAILILASFAVLTRSQFARWIGDHRRGDRGRLGRLVDPLLPRVGAHLRDPGHPRGVRPGGPRWPCVRLTSGPACCSPSGRWRPCFPGAPSRT